MRHLIRPEVLRAASYAEYGKELNPASVSETYGIPIDEVVDLSLNVNVFGPPHAACDAVWACLGGLANYPDPGQRGLRSEIAALHGLLPEQVLAGAGIDDLLKLLCQAVIGPGDRAIIPIPTFTRYALEVELMGGEVDAVPLNPDFTLPVEAILARVTPRTRLIFICAPNNPTGAQVCVDDIERLLALGDEGPLVVVDEALIYPLAPGVTGLLARPVPPSESVPSQPHPAGYRNLLVLRTFSKLAGLAGARVGYALADPELLSYVEAVRPTYNVGTLAEVAALEALRDVAFLENSRAVLHLERDRLCRLLAELPGLRPRLSDTSILLIDVTGTGLTSTEMCVALAARGVVVVDCRLFPGLEQANYLRISIGARPSNDRLVEALTEILTN